MILYHTTKRQNIDSILQTGIKQSSCGIVYLSENPNSWVQDKDDVVFEINFKKVPKIKLTTFNDPNLDEVLCWGPIPKEAITLYKL